MRVTTRCCSFTFTSALHVFIDGKFTLDDVRIRNWEWSECTWSCYRLLKIIRVFSLNLGSFSLRVLWFSKMTIKSWVIFRFKLQLLHKVISYFQLFLPPLKRLSFIISFNNQKSFRFQTLRFILLIVCFSI